MPESNIIGLFILGAILLIIAFMGGKFKLFGAEFSDRIDNPYLRILAGILGLVFIAISFNPHLVEQRNISLPSSTAVSVTAIISPTTSPNTPVSAEIVAATPKQAVRSYFELIQNCKIDQEQDCLAWNYLLSPNFIQYQNTVKKGYNDLVSFWQLYIPITVEEVIANESGMTSTARARLNFSNKPDNDRIHNYHIELIFDAISKRWLLDKVCEIPQECSG